MSQVENNKNKNRKESKKNKIIFAVSALLAIIVFSIGAYIILSKIKSSKTSEGLSQDQFEGTPEVSSQLQTDCQQSAIKISGSKDIQFIENEYRMNADNCKDVYFTIEFESPFRKEGMYADLAVDLAKYISSTDKQKGLELLKFARSLKSWEFYLGPVSCDSQHVLEAYIESYSLSDDKLCIKPADYKLKLLSDVQNKNYSIFSKMITNDQVVWLGQPESDAGCPEKISSVVEILNKLTQGTITVEEPKPDLAESTDLNLRIKSGDVEKATLVFSTVNDCLRLNSVLVPSLEVSE